MNFFCKLLCSRHRAHTGSRNTSKPKQVFADKQLRYTDDRIAEADIDVKARKVTPRHPRDYGERSPAFGWSLKFAACLLDLELEEIAGVGHDRGTKSFVRRCEARWKRGVGSITSADKIDVAGSSCLRPKAELHRVAALQQPGRILLYK